MRSPTLIAVMSLLLAVAAHASGHTAEEKLLIKQGSITISAFECGAIAVDPKQGARLSSLALSNGRTFLEALKRDPKLWPKIGNEVPTIWALISGPSADFILGAVSNKIATDVYSKWTSDEQEWRQIRNSMFFEKNCALLE